MQGYDLKFNDFWCHPLFRSYLRIRKDEMGLTQKAMAKRCSMSESTLLRCYGGSDHAFTTFAVLFGLCRGHKFNLTLHTGSSFRPHSTYTVKYSGDFTKFRHELGSTLVRARKSIGATQRSKLVLNGAGQTQIHRIENAIGTTVKPTTIHRIFETLNAELIINIKV